MRYKEVNGHLPLMKGKAVEGEGVQRTDSETSLGKGKEAGKPTLTVGAVPARDIRE